MSADAGTRHPGNRAAMHRARLQLAEDEIGKVIVGQDRMIRAMICALISRGHVLLEGVPGLGKSLAVSTFARVIGGEFKRIQFTPDKLPSDITGTTVFNEATGGFDFHRGPVFCNVLLADEINRAAPKVQSALLEAMQERVVSMDRDRYELPDLFMVLATQNPVEQLGTYPLSEAQLDRFMAKLEVDYPARGHEQELFRKKTADFEQVRRSVPRILSPPEVLETQQCVADSVAVPEAILSYILEICLRTRPVRKRTHPSVRKYVTVGVSPRGGEHLIAFCRSYAFLEGRTSTTFADVDACAELVLGHRLVLSDVAVLEGVTGAQVVRDVVRTVSPYDVVPTTRL